MAQYGGDANYSPSSSSAVQETIKPGSLSSSSTTLAASPNPGIAGQVSESNRYCDGSRRDAERNRDLPERQRCAGHG